MKRLKDMTEPELRLLLRATARAVEETAESFDVERPMFALLLFNDPAVAQYVCNCERADVIKAMRECAARLERSEAMTRPAEYKSAPTKTGYYWMLEVRRRLGGRGAVARWAAHPRAPRVAAGRELPERDVLRAAETARTGETIMTHERFNELLNGPLNHPLPMFTITRLAIALRAVVEATGEAGERALEAHCAARAEEDEPEELREEYCDD